MNNTVTNICTVLLFRQSWKSQYTQSGIDVHLSLLPEMCVNQKIMVTYKDTGLSNRLSLSVFLLHADTDLSYDSANSISSPHVPKLTDLSNLSAN